MYVSPSIPLILIYQADEEIFHSQLLTIHSLLTQMTKLDAEQGNVGTLAPASFRECLVDFFKLQESAGEGEADAGADKDGVASSSSAARASSLAKAATLELEVGEDAPLDYKSLFTEVTKHFVS